jgi:hypothetical protein
LKITKTTQFELAYAESSKAFCGVAGLFGFCENASIGNLNVGNASVQIENASEHDQLYVGTLIGKLNLSMDAEIGNIKVHSSDVQISNEKSLVPKVGATAMYVGGIIGYTKNDDSVQLKLNRLECKASILYGDTRRSSNFIGGITGYITNSGDLDCSDFASYLTTETPTYRGNKFYIGAFGAIYNGIGNCSLSNGFSKMCLEENDMGKYGEQYTHLWKAILGNGQRTDNGKLELENLFGFIEVTKDGVTNNQYELFFITESEFVSETNCLGCTALPANHGFDGTVWNLEDLSAPTLK